MDHLIYTAASGARATMLRQDSITQNLANANTTGYRADQAVFRAVPVRGDGATTRVVAIEASTTFDDQSGAIEPTGRNLDVAIRGKGYFAVQAKDGSEAYTRNGSFEVNAEGTLVAHGGLPVAGEGGTLTIPPNAIVSIGNDGTVTAQQGTTTQTVGKLKLVDAAAGELRKGPDGLLRTATGADLPTSESARVVAGSLEGSNTNVIGAMVDMIAASRQFEHQLKLLQSAEQNDKQASQLLGVVR